MSSLGKRVSLLVLGFIIIGAGVGMLIFLDLGIDPFGVMILGLSDSFEISFGTMMMMLQVLIFTLVIFKKKELAGIGTVIGMFGIGYVIEIFAWVWSNFIQVELTLVMRLLILAIVLIVISFGVSLTIVANLGLVPYDALGFVIEEMSGGKLKFNIARMGTDGLSTIVGFLLGATIGVATLMTVLIIGPFVNFFSNKIRSLASKWIDNLDEHKAPTL